MAMLAQDFSELVASCEATPAEVGLPTEATDIDLFNAGLRQWRNAAMAAVARDDIAGSLDLRQVLGRVTGIAEQAIQAAVNFHLPLLQERYGHCHGADGELTRFVVLGMGKLGGGELNFSSDIDLICLYDRPGQCDGARSISAEEFYGKLVKAISKSLNQQTADGFVFRVDLRLRPFGGAGPLVMHFDQAENYYETHGRDWERYAFIKARVVAGDIAAGEAFLKRLKPFIYRRYIDFTALHGLRELKAKIEKQYALKRLDDNIKLGPGGIREVEFIAQSFQLVRGGQHVELQTQSLYQALSAAKQLGLISSVDQQGLVTSYEFLRVVENRLQQRRDQQVHHLPEDGDEQQLLAQVLGFADWSDFTAELSRHRSVVNEQFKDVLAIGSEAEEELDKHTEVPLCEEAQKALDQLLQGRTYAQLSDRAEGYLSHIIEYLPRLSFAQPVREGQLAIIRLIEKILGRTTYLALLSDQMQALERLAFFVSRSSWMAEQVIAQPRLLDDLLDERSLIELPDKAGKLEELWSQLRLVEAEDLEQAMNVCRHFKSSMQFRIAAADVANYLPVMRVSDHLTELAEVVLQVSLRWVEGDLQRKTGQPILQLDDESRVAEMLVVGYGKLGGYELGYGSDLDIVLLHDADGVSKGTDGAKQLENQVYFQRLGQRLVHFMSANTPAGRLYEIDTRLRPSGNSGLLVTSLKAYEKYQQQSAWTWEHQAVVRARAVAGPEGLRHRFESIRSALLAAPRDAHQLKLDVLEMRQKMRDHLDDSDEAHVNLKHAPGGLVDIEFICQYLVLLHAQDEASVFFYTDNVRQIEALAGIGILTQAQSEQLKQAYLDIRSATHHQKLGYQGEDLLAGLNEKRQQVVAIWKELLE